MPPSLGIACTGGVLKINPHIMSLQHVSEVPTVAKKRSKKPPAKKPRARRPGVPCPSCQHPFSHVVRTTTKGAIVSRQRSCAKCSRKFVTRECVVGSDTGVTSLASAVAFLNKMVETTPHLRLREAC